MRILLVVLLLVASGCMPTYFPPQPGPGPAPVPVPPTPEPAPELTRSSFAGINVGDTMEALNVLPPATSTAQVGNRAIYSWPIRERRPDGGWVRWEVHVEGGEIVSSLAW